MTHEVQILQVGKKRPGGSRRRLPAPPAQPTTGVRAAGPGFRSGPLVRPLRVLVVDDCRDTTDSTAELVGLWGHDARRAYGGADALQVAAEYRPDVLLVDLAMPGVDGYAVARRARSLPGLHGALVIAVTGYMDAEHRRRAAAAGFDFYVVKPVDPKTLEALLMSRQVALSAAPPRRPSAPPTTASWWSMTTTGYSGPSRPGCRGRGSTSGWRPTGRRRPTSCGPAARPSTRS